MQVWAENVRFTWHPSRDQHHRRQAEVSVQVQDLLKLGISREGKCKTYNIWKQILTLQRGYNGMKNKIKYRLNVELRIFYVSSSKILPKSWNLLRQSVQEIWHKTGKDESQEQI